MEVILQEVQLPTPELQAVIIVGPSDAETSRSLCVFISSPPPLNNTRFVVDIKVDKKIYS